MMNPADDIAALAGLRVLLAEDEMAVAMALEMLLEAHDCEVIKAAHLPQVLALAQTEHFDGALLDINLDGDEVYPVAEALAARGIPFIFLTGYSAEHVKAPWRDRPVLEKPFPPEELESLMATTFVAQR